MLSSITQGKAYLHAALAGHWPWLDRTLAGLIDFVTGPLTGVNTRYYWVFLAQAVVLAAIFHAVRGGTLRGFYRFCLPHGTLTHTSTRVDLQINIANQIFGQSFKLFWRLTMPAIAAFLLAGLQTSFGPAPHLWPWNGASLLILTALVTVGDDLGYYAFHRAAHTLPWLWSFHKVHHSAEVLTPLVAGRVHPVEMALSEPVRAAASAIMLAPGLYFFAGDATLLTVFGIKASALLFGALGNQLLHSQVPISWGPKVDRVLVSPLVHHIHHSTAPRHRNRNFGGLLSVWDWMFGTLVLPVPGETLRFGLGEEAAQIHPNVLMAYALPFWEILPGKAFWSAGAQRFLPARQKPQDTM